MIHINLLPVREARRKANLRQYVMQLALVMLVTAAGIGFAHSRISEQISQTKLRVSQMQRDIDQFKPQLEQVDAFRKKKAGLEKKIDVIDGLDRARSGPVRVMDELAIHSPERLWLTSLQAKGSTIELKGESLDNELVAVFLTALGESPYFDQVELDSTELGSGADGLKTVTFRIHAVLVAPKPAVKG
ncbi:MAG: PilN domain-containing protein [Myxococcales bacterium]|nr:PilN domain-containing protein [Myxococcales bacterium]MDH5305807.1 PilN domain-containing protein [Myxococcales bacterium]MDH5566806.1 PilN domain-containing protein [Myxococcales bacterium]